MKILLGVLLGLIGITFGLAFAFLSSDNTVVFNEGLKMTDEIVAVVIHG